MDKQMLVCPYDRLLLRNFFKKSKTTDTHSKIHEFQKHRGREAWLKRVHIV